MPATIEEAMNGGELERPVVVVSLIPRSYSETIGEVIGALKLGLTVRVVESDDLAEQVARLRPDLVLCSQPYAAFRSQRPPHTSWLEYYPYAEPPDDEIRIDGQSSGQRDVELSDLISLIDRALTSN